MRVRTAFFTAGLLLVAATIARVGAQGAPPAQTPPPGQAPPATPPPAGQGAATQGRGRGAATFPAQQRPLADPAVIARGKGLYEASCRLCHGADLRGGEGPNLLRSETTMNDLDGELISVVIRDGRGNMAAVGMPADDAKAVAAYVRSVLAQGRGQGAPPAGPRVQLNVLVGDAAAGETYFKATCSACHTGARDLKGIGTRITDVVQLQNAWVSGRGSGRGGGRGAGGGGGGETGVDPRAVTVTVTLANGQKVEGRLGRVDDFIVTLTDADGMSRSFRRDGDLPKVEVHDPLEPHKRLMLGYTDKNIHDVTAYLVTLK